MEGRTRYIPELEYIIWSIGLTAISGSLYPKVWATWQIVTKLAWHGAFAIAFIVLHRKIWQFCIDKLNMQSFKLFYGTFAVTGIYVGLSLTAFVGYGPAFSDNHVGPIWLFFLLGGLTVGAVDGILMLIFHSNLAYYSTISIIILAGIAKIAYDLSLNGT